MSRSLVLILMVLAVPVFCFATGASSVLTTHVLSASLERTVVAARFDAAALTEEFQAQRDGEAFAGLPGFVLAISGQGIPSARVLSYELGGTVPDALLLAPDQIAPEPEGLVILDPPAIWHELRIVTVNLRPVVRDASGMVRFLSRADIEVVTEGLGGDNVAPEPLSFSQAFYPLYRSVIANLDEAYPEHSVRTPGRYLVIGSTRWLNDLSSSLQWQRWLDLKRRKGYTVQVATLRDIRQAIGDSTAQSIRQYILQTYHDASQPDLEYVLLVGDHTDVPTFNRMNPEHETEYSVGDHLYFTVAGGDLLADVLHGRVSGVSGDQYRAYFNKVYLYEVQPYTEDMSWFQSATFVAGNYSDGTGLYPVTPVWNVNWARERLMRDGCITNADTFYYHNQSDPPPGQYRIPLRNDINSGVCMVIYRGWGGSQGWQYPVFNIEDASALTCGRRNPAFFSIVCGSANFAFGSGQCLGEYLTTGSGTISQPNGAIFFLGASDLHTNTRHNNAVLAGIVEAMLVHSVRSGGALLQAGKLEAWRQFPLERAGGEQSFAFFYILHVFNLLGDPETQIYACRPRSFELTHPTVLSAGETLIPVTVSADGMPADNAVVTVRERGMQTVVTARTNASGQVFLPVSFSTGDTAQLCVWKSAHFMRWVGIPIVSQAYDPKIAAVNWNAGGDGLPNPGEDVSFTVTLQNLGTAPLTPALTATSQDSRVTVLQGTATAATIAPGASGATTPLTIRLGGELYDGERPRLSILIQDGANQVTRHLPVPVTAPDPVILSLQVMDGGNGILEAGETADIHVTVQNVGGQDAVGLTAIVSSFDNAISFPVNQVSWPAVNRGQSATSNAPFRAAMPAGVTPGRQIRLRFEFRNGGVVVARKLFDLPTGVVTANVPTGPDAYGYYAYEDIDVGYAATPTYNWIELDPAYGGSGATAHEVRDDTHFAIALPVPFTFYGQSFDSLWICSNGWFSFERATIPEFRNWEIPSPIGPPSMVCPFWDDLIGDRTWPNDDTLHYVWTRHDPAQNRFVIQWRALARGGLSSGGQPNTAFCVFEAILEYAPAGDGSILVQYNLITNIDDTRGTGNYATVGIQDSYHQSGLGLCYANRYLPSVDTLRAGRAIRFTTTPPDNFSGGAQPAPLRPLQFALHEPAPNPFNPVTQLTFELPEPGYVTLRIYDILGRETATLMNGWRDAGRYTATFTARNLPSGLYFAKLMQGSQTQVRKLLLAK